MFWPPRQIESPDSTPDSDPLQDRTCVLAAYSLISLANANTQATSFQLPLSHRNWGEYAREMEFARRQQFATTLPHWSQNRLLMI